jgi:type IV pilus assembly protein PilP
VTLGVLALTARVFAQAAAAPKSEAPPASAAAPQADGKGQPAPPPSSAPDSYTYEPDGRRDPFISLVARGAQPANVAKRTEGLAGVTTDEVSVRGVLLSRGAYVALVQAPDGKTFMAHVNDHLVDGTIRSITADGLVIMQEVNDPLSLVKQREVRKGLRVSEDVKQ